MSSIKVGFIGMGNLGMVMARSIAKKGIPLTVYDLNKEAIDEMVALGAKAAGSCREVAENSDIVISMVRDIPQTDEVIFGKDGVWEGVKEGSIIVLTSTIGPSYCQELYAKAKEKGVRVVDAGVSKSIPSNEEGMLTLMIGGDDDAVKKCWPAFEAMAKYNFYLGEIGAGQACKLVNNMLGINIGTLIRECLNVGLKAGLDLQKMMEAMTVGTGGSWMLQAMASMRKSGARMAPPPSPPPTPPGAKAPENIGSKDKRLAIELAEAVGADIPIAQFLETLDTSVYDAYSAAMRR